MAQLLLKDITDKAPPHRRKAHQRRIRAWKYLAVGWLYGNTYSLDEHRRQENGNREGDKAFDSKRYICNRKYEMGKNLSYMTVFNEVIDEEKARELKQIITVTNY